MASNSKYVVKVEVSYVHMEFEFNSLMGAGNFMDMFIDHFAKDNSDVSKVCMVRIDPEEIKEEEAE